MRESYRLPLIRPGTIKEEFRKEEGCGLSPRVMPSTHKKVIVRKMDRDSVSGYVSPTHFINEGKVDVLNTSGTVISVDLREIKGVYFVREFGDSESLTRKTFTSRPRAEGLWVRLRFKDSEVVEGLMPADLTQSMPEGYLVNPPDQRSNTQRIFLPRHGSRISDSAGSHWRSPSSASRLRRSAAGADVRGIKVLTGLACWRLLATQLIVKLPSLQITPISIVNPNIPAIVFAVHTCKRTGDLPSSFVWSLGGH